MSRQAEYPLRDLLWVVIALNCTTPRRVARMLTGGAWITGCVVLVPSQAMM
jgi:hypothetical protein